MTSSPDLGEGSGGEVVTIEFVKQPLPPPPPLLAVAEEGKGEKGQFSQKKIINASKG